MDKEYYKTMKLYITALSKTDDIELNMLKRVISECPTTFKEGVGSQNIPKNPASEICAETIINTRSITTLSLGICHFLAKSNWKLCECLIPGLLRIFKTSLVPESISDFLFDKKSNKNHPIINLSLWTNFFILPCTLCSYALTLDPSSEMYTSIITEMILFWINVARNLLKNFIEITKNTTEESLHTDNYNFNLRRLNLLWQILLFSHITMGTFMPLSSQDLDSLISNPSQFHFFLKKSLNINFKIPNTVLKLLSELLNENVVLYFQDFSSLVHQDAFSFSQVYSPISIFIYSISTSIFQIFKICKHSDCEKNNKCFFKLKTANHMLLKILKIRSSKFGPLFPSAQKVKNLSSLLNCEKLYLSFDDKLYRWCLFDQFELSIYLIESNKFAQIDSTVNEFFQNFMSIANCKWPVDRGQIFIKEAYLNGIKTLIKTFPTHLERLRIKELIIDALTKPSEILSLIGSFVDPQILKSYTNTLTPFTFKFMKEEKSIREISLVYAYYFYFKQKFILILLECLKNVLVTISADNNEIIMECISCFSHTFMDWGAIDSIDSITKEATPSAKICIAAQALGYIGAEFSNQKSVVDAAIMALQQKFMRPISPLDSYIVNNLIYLLLSMNQNEIYAAIMGSFKKTLISNTSENEGDSCESRLKYSCQFIVSSLNSVSLFIENSDLMLLNLQDMIEIYIQFSLNLRKYKKQTLTSQYLITYLSFIMKGISCIISRIGPITSSNPKLQQLFKNLWVNIVFMSTTNTGPFSVDIINYYHKISTYSPPLGVDHLSSDLQYNLHIKDESFDSYELTDIRNLLIDCLECTQIDITNIILRLPALHVIFLLAIFEQETLAVEYDTSRFPHLFLYLEDKALENDKQNIGTLVEYTCDKIFSKFVSNLQKLPHSLDSDVSIINHSKLLLVKFNSENKRVQRNADKYLSILFNKFPHLLWNTDVVRMILGFIHILKTTFIEMGSICESWTIDVPNTNLKYITPDTKEKRESILVDFLSRCESLINEAVRWAPTVIRSIVLQCLVEKNSTFKDLYTHYGIELLMSTIIFQETQNKNPSIIDSETMFQKLNMLDSRQQFLLKPSKDLKLKTKKKEITKENYTSSSVGFVSKCTFTASLRSYYIGKIEGFLYLKKELDHSSTPQLDFEEFTIRKLKEKHTLSNSEIADIMMISTAHICVTRKFNRKIIFQLCHLPVELCSTDYMLMIIECWEWILSSCPDYQVSLMQNIWISWENTMVKGIGLFKLFSSKAPIYSQTTVENSLVHDIWLKYLIQRFDAIKFYDQEQVRIISQIVIQSLQFILSKKITLPYIDANCVPLLRLVCLGFKLLQNTYTSNILCRSILREKLFRLLLLYFGIEMVWPNFQKTSELLDIFCLIYHLLVGDRNSNKQEEEVDISSLQTLDIKKVSQEEKKLSMRAESSTNFLTVGNRIKKTSSKSHSKLDIIFSDNISNVTHGGTNNTNASLRSFTSYGLLSLRSNDISLIRSIILHLISKEIDRFSVWINPTDKSEAFNQYTKMSKSPFFDKKYSEKLRILWKYSPITLFNLPQRINDVQTLIKDISCFIASCPSKLIDNFHAVGIFWSEVQESSAYTKQIKSLLMLWSPSPISNTLQFICPLLHPLNLLSTQYFISCLKSATLDEVLFFIPQLVQCLRYDVWFYVEEYILWISQRTKLISHQFIWNMLANIHLDDECTKKEPVIGDKLISIIDIIKKNFDSGGLRFYQKEFSFFEKITNISAILKPIEKSERKPICQKELAKIVPELGVYLPTNPDSLIFSIDYSSGIPMQSAAKAPYLARFNVYPVTTDIVEEVNSFDEVSVPDFNNGNAQIIQKGAIFKVGDDVRQDVLALQIMQIFKNVFEKLGLKLFLFPYKVVATAPGCGVIECVPDAKSRDQLGKQTDASLYKYFISTFGSENSDAFKTARENFASSLAAYSIFTYILQVKDRHNGNIMINKNGFLIHIDFGFLFESSPGGNVGFEPDMKITGEMLKILGGSIDAPYFKSFMAKSIQGFLAIRPYQEDIVNIVALMLDTNFPCFRGETIKRLRARFANNLNDKDASRFFEKLIFDSCLNYRTRLYDLIQYAQNEIPY